MIRTCMRGVVCGALSLAVLGLSMLFGTGCAAIEKYPGQVLAALGGCVPDVIATVVQAVHSAPADTWVAQSANALSAVDDVMGCVDKIRTLEQEALACKVASTDVLPPCAAPVSMEAVSRLAQLPAVGRTTLYLRQRFVIPRAVSGP